MSKTAGLQIVVEHSTARSAAEDLARLSGISKETERATLALVEATKVLSSEIARSAKASEESAAAQRELTQQIERQKEADRNAAAARSASALDSQKKRELEIVRRSLLSQEEAIRESYLRQRQIIESSGAPKATQMGLLARLDTHQAKDIATLREKERAPEEQARKELASLVAAQQSKTAAKAAELAKEEAATRAALRAEFDDLKRSLLSEEGAIRDSYARRRATVRASVASQAEQNRLLRSLDKAEGKELAAASPGLGRQLAGAAATAAPLVGAAVAVGGLMEIGKITRDFEKLNAGLITSTGSAGGAERAFAALQQKAADTPYTLQEVTGAFTKLVNYGLQPSERALTSYGNTSSALGKGLTDMIEAVADATQGEFERLKEFGIKASAQGDKVTFMFRGVKTTVDRDSKAIQDYLIKLGETNFGDAMANRMTTLDGKLSNLQDAWESLFRTMGQSGIGDLLKDAADTGIEALTGIEAYIMGASFNEAIIALKGGFEEIAHVAHKAAGFATWLVTGDTSMSRNADATIQAERERLALQQLEARQAAKEREEQRALQLELKTTEKNFADLTEQKKKGLVDSATYEAARSSLVNMRAMTAEAIDTQVKAADAQKKVAELRNKANETIAALMAKGASRKDATAEVQARLTEAAAEQKMLSAQYDRLLTSSDRLGGFEKSGTNKKGPTQEQINQEKKDRTEFEGLQKKLIDEEGAIEASFERRQLLVDRYANKKSGEWATMSAANVDQRFEDLQKTTAARQQQEREKETEELRKSLRTQQEVLRESLQEKQKLALGMGDGPARDQMLSRLQDKYDAELDALNSSEDAKIQAIRDSFATEMELFKKQQEEKRQTILESERLTAEQKNALLAKLTAQTEEREAEESQKRMELAVSSSAQLFGSLAKVAKNVGAENSSTYRALFAASKAFAIANATLSIASGTADALKLGWPAGLAAGLQVAAQGAKLLADITSSNYAGAYDAGGDIPSGKFAVVGEKRPEIVWGPATVTGGQDTARLFAQQRQANNSSNSGGYGGGSMKIVMAPDMNTAAKHLATTEGERVWLAIAGKHATELRSLTGGR
jgi:hypothetical protein